MVGGMQRERQVSPIAWRLSKAGVLFGRGAPVPVVVVFCVPVYVLVGFCVPVYVVVGFCAPVYVVVGFCAPVYVLAWRTAQLDLTCFLYLTSAHISGR